MPIYEYSCEKCGEQFEEFVFAAEAEPDCPKCGQEGCKRLMSISRGSANSKGGTGLAKDLSGGFDGDPSGGLSGGGCGGGSFN